MPRKGRSRGSCGDLSQQSPARGPGWLWGGRRSGILDTPPRQLPGAARLLPHHLPVHCRRRGAALLGDTGAGAAAPSPAVPERSCRRQWVTRAPAKPVPRGGRGWKSSISLLQGRSYSCHRDGNVLGSQALSEGQALGLRMLQDAPGWPRGKAQHLQQQRGHPSAEGTSSRQDIIFHVSSSDTQRTDVNRTARPSGF